MHSHLNCSLLLEIKKVYSCFLLQGALALEDALSKGLPIQKEIDALNSYIDGIDNDSLLGLVMASLPEDTLKNGTDTILQLNHKVSLSMCSILLYYIHHNLCISVTTILASF